MLPDAESAEAQSLADSRRNDGFSQGEGSLGECSLGLTKANIVSVESEKIPDDRMSFKAYSKEELKFAEKDLVK
jgi:hypothetical protein